MAILGFRMAGVTLTDSGVGLFIAVLRPSAPVVIQRIAGEEGRLIRRALGAQTAGCAGFVVDCLFGTGCGGFQILLLGGFCREAVCRHLAVFAAADRTDSLVCAGCRAAGAILGFRMRCIVSADAGVRAVPVGCPSAIVMAERLAIGKGFRALRTAGGAGLIIYRRACAGGGGLQPVFVHLIDKMVRAKLAVRVLADLAEGRGKAVGRAALMRAAIDLQMAAGVESPVAVAVKLPVTRLFGVPIRVRFPGGKGRLAGRSLGGQHTDLAGLVIECGREAVCFLVQKCRDRKFSREVVLGHFDAAGVAEMVAVRVGVVEPLSLSAADGAGLPVTVLIRAPVAVGAAGRFNMAGIVGADALVCALPVGRPCAPVMAERLSGREGRLVGGSLGAGTADGAGLVIHRLFGAGRSGFQILLLGGFCREAVRRKVAVGFSADRTNSLVRAVCRTAVAILGFRMAGVAGADAGVGDIAVGRPCAPFMAQNAVGFKGSLAGRTLGAQATNRAGLVVDRFLRAAGAGFQVLLLCRFCREVVGQLFAVLGIAGTALCLGGAGGRAAGTIIGFGGVAVLTPACPRVRTVAIGRPTPQMAQRCARLLIQMIVIVFDLTAHTSPVVNSIVSAVRRRFQCSGITVGPGVEFVLVPLRYNVDRTHRVASCQIAIGHVLSNGDITAFPAGEYPVLIRGILGQVFKHLVSPPDDAGTSAGNSLQGVTDGIILYLKMRLNGHIFGRHCEGQHRVDPAAALRLVEENPFLEPIARCRRCRQRDRFARLGLCAHGRYRTPLRHADLNYRDGVFVLRPMGVEGLRTEHRHGGVFLNLGAAVLFRVPTGEIVALIVGNRQRAVGIAGRQRSGLVRIGQRTAVGVKGHGKGPRNRTGDKVQLPVILILHMGIGVVRKEALRIVSVVSIGKRHGVAGVCGGHANSRPGGHADLDGHRLAGGQIHIVGLAGNRVVLHEGLVSDLQLAAVAGIDINAAAIAAGFVILDLTAIELADRAGAVNIHAAAVAGGRIAGDLAALHNQPRRLLIQIDGAAVAAGVSGDLAVIEEELAVLVKHMNRAAL